MKNGATTVHRAYGVPVGFCGPSSRGVKVSPHFLKRKRRLQATKLHVIDEFSMMGRALLGKIDFKNQVYERVFKKLNNCCQAH